MTRILLIAITLLHLQNSNKRILAIYVTSADNANYKQQLQLLAADKAGLDERDIEVKTYIYSNSTAAKFKKHAVKGPFTVTLTGKDGGEKHRTTQPITLQKLYGIIDAMPMRRDEMKMK